MHLILSYFNNVVGPSYLIASNPVLAKPIESLVENLMNLDQQGFFQHNSEENDVYLVNYRFEVPSQWARGNHEDVMLSVAIDPLLNPISFKSILKDYAELICNSKDIYKAFYMNSLKEDAEITPKFQILENIFYDLIQKCDIKLQNSILGQILILGIQNVGKTTLVNQLTAKIFQPNIKPTLGIQMTRVFIENFKLNIVDVGGQMNLRNFWNRITFEPQAIVFVISCNSSETEKFESKTLFDRIYEHFSTQSGYKQPIDQIPILILCNKIDLDSNYSLDNLKKDLPMEKIKANYHMGLTSALKNIGVIPNFRWLIEQLL